MPLCQKDFSSAYALRVCPHLLLELDNIFAASGTTVISSLRDHFKTNRHTQIAIPGPGAIMISPSVLLYYATAIADMPALEAIVILKAEQVNPAAHPIKPQPKVEKTEK